MSRYLLSPRARRDLDEIWTYTVRRWGSVQAERYTLAVKDACEALVSGHMNGVAIDDIRPGYWRLTVGSHFLFYRPTDKGEIEVVRILHQRMDVRARLEGS